MSAAAAGESTVGGGSASKTVWQVLNEHGLDAGTEDRMAIFETQEGAVMWVGFILEEGNGGEYNVVERTLTCREM